MVVDGDTIRFSNSRNRLTDNYQVIRLLGVQSPEKLSGASGCEGVVAHEFLRNAIEGRSVVLASSSDSRSSIRNRRLRTVCVKQDDGSWIDASALMLNAGLGRWMPKKYEPVHNLEYRHLFDAALARGERMWNPAFCGPGVGGESAAGDPARSDRRRRAEHQRRIRGDRQRRPEPCGPVPVDHPRRQPRLAAVAGRHRGGSRWRADRALRLGHEYRVQRLLGAPDSVWANFTTARGTRTKFGFIGDGAYLLDTRGSVRASKVYPCLECTDPARGYLRIASVKYDPLVTSAASPTAN